METKEEVFPGGHQASVWRAVVKVNKRRRETQALDTTREVTGTLTHVRSRSSGDE